MGLPRSVVTMSLLRTLSILLLVFLFLRVETSFAQERLPEQPLDTLGSESSWSLKKWGAFSMSAGIFSAVLVNSYFEWWKGSGQKWGFFDPERKRGEWFHEVGIRGMDKIGHAYSTYFFYEIQKAVLEWGGFTPEEAMWWSAGFSYGVVMLIEVGDGFSDYSFDYRDVIMNTAGLLFGVGRDMIPFMRHFNFKWGYYPEKLTFRISQNYYAGSFWLTTDIVSIITGNEGDPFIVQPAIGYSVTPRGGHPELLIGFDFDLNGLLRSDNEYLEVIRKIADPYHLPAPGMKISPGYHPRYEPFLLR